MSRFRLTSPPKPKLSENDVERACLDVLRYRGYRPVRVPAGKYRTPDVQRWVQIGEPGMPDYVIPQFFLEVKRPGGELSLVQQLKISELTQGWNLETAVVDSVEALAEWLARFENKS